MEQFWKYFVSITFVIVTVSGEPTTCELDKVKATEITEQDPPGTVLLTLNVSDVITYSFSLSGDSSHDVLKDYFMSTTNETTFTLSLNKTLDLEVIYELHKISLSAVTVMLSCTQNGNPGGSKQFFVVVNAVNEFKPEFINAPFELNVTENTPEKTSLFRLRDHATDQDVNPGQEEITDFEIFPYFAHEFDGRPYFTLSDVQNGVVSVLVPPDYEGINRDQKYFFLNLTVYDYGRKYDQTTMKIHILDGDDLPPEFFEPNCSSNCYVLYETTIDVNFTGLLDNIDPHRIQARDRDTLNHSLAYTIKGNTILSSTTRITTQVTYRNKYIFDERYIFTTLHVFAKPKDYDTYFNQDKDSGEVTVIKPFSDDNDSVSLVTLFLEAQETEGQHAFAQTSFKITIDRGLPPTTDKPEEKVAEAGIDNTLLIVLIVLAVVVFVLAGSFIIAVFCLKKKLRKNPIYPDDSSSPSEKETDVEELSADGQEQWPAIGEADLNGLPTGRGQTLPPLKDMATGTEEGKKRRSRRRKKEKDNTEFDGTQEYESSAEPEFFEQKKTRIKRSSRSKLQTDPKYWITVDNDY